MARPEPDVTASNETPPTSSPSSPSSISDASHSNSTSHPNKGTSCPANEHRAPLKIDVRQPSAALSQRNPEGRRRTYRLTPPATPGLSASRPSPHGRRAPQGSARA